MLCLQVMTATVSLTHTIPNVGIYVSTAVTFVICAVIFSIGLTSRLTHTWQDADLHCECYHKHPYCTAFLIRPVASMAASVPLPFHD